MKKKLLWISCLFLIVGCGGGHDDLELIKKISPLRDIPIPEEIETLDNSQELKLNPILEDSIITLEEQEELIKLVENLLEELAYYKRMYYLQLLKK